MATPLTEYEWLFTFVFQINILINQITGRVNYAADLIGVRMASINQILDPWLYILLRKRVIVKIVIYIGNLILCRKTISPKRSKYGNSSSHGNNSYTNFRNDRNCHELNHLDTLTHINEDPVKDQDNAAISTNARVNQNDQQLSDSSANSTTNLISGDDEIPANRETGTRLRRTWSLDGNLSRTNSEKVASDCEEDERNIRHLRKASIQSFLRIIERKNYKRKQSLPVKLQTV